VGGEPVRGRAADDGLVEAQRVEPDRADPRGHHPRSGVPGQVRVVEVGVGPPVLVPAGPEQQDPARGEQVRAGLQVRPLDPPVGRLAADVGDDGRPEEVLERHLVDARAVVEEVVRGVDVGAGLGAHPHVQDVVAVGRDRGGRREPGDRVAGVHRGVVVQRVREVDHLADGSGCGAGHLASSSVTVRG
jgi:hypothetical protein